MTETKIILNPPLRVNCVRIQAIDIGQKIVTFILHVPVHPDNLQTPSVQRWINQQVFAAWAYLEKEGFVSNLQNNNWTYKATCILHPPLNSL